MRPASKFTPDAKETDTRMNERALNWRKGSQESLGTSQSS